MRDHRNEMTPEERLAQQRTSKDITELMLGQRRTGISTEERRRRRAKRKAVAKSKRGKR